MNRYCPSSKAVLSYGRKPRNFVDFHLGTSVSLSLSLGWPFLSLSLSLSPSYFFCLFLILSLSLTLSPSDSLTLSQSILTSHSLTVPLSHRLTLSLSRSPSPSPTQAGHNALGPCNDDLRQQGPETCQQTSMPTIIEVNGISRVSSSKIDELLEEQEATDTNLSTTTASHSFDKPPQQPAHNPPTQPWEPSAHPKTGNHPLHVSQSPGPQSLALPPKTAPWGCPSLVPDHQHSTPPPFTLAL